MQYTISLFQNKYDIAPKVKTITWADMIRKCSRPDIRADKDGWLMCGATFAHDVKNRQPHRLLELANEASIIFGDVDHGATFQDCVEIVKAHLGCGAILYTTHSHRQITDKNPHAEDRIRIVIPLAFPVPANRFPALWQWIQIELGGLLDKSCKDVSRMVYTPAICAADAPYEFEVTDGAPFEWRDLSLEAPERETPSVPMAPAPEAATNGWDELLAELRSRIMAHPTAHKIGSGKIACRGICHNGKSDSALFINRMGVVWCSNEGCRLRDVLRAFGLPEKPEMPDIEVCRAELAGKAGVVIVTDRRQAEHYAATLHCSAVALRRPFKYAGKKTVVSIFDHLSSINKAVIPITAEQHADPQTMQGVRRLVKVLRSLEVRVEVFEVER